MKLCDALTKYRDYRAELVEQQRNLAERLKEAQINARVTGESRWSDEAATLELSLYETNEKFEKNQEVLDGLIEQYVAAFNMEVAKQQSDPDNGIAAEMGKIMTTVARMCAGDKVPTGDEKKVMEYDTLWEEKEAKEYDPEGVANNTEAVGELPETGAYAPLFFD